MRIVAGIERDLQASSICCGAMGRWDDRTRKRTVSGWVVCIPVISDVAVSLRIARWIILELGLKRVALLCLIIDSIRS